MVLVKYQVTYDLILGTIISSFVGVNFYNSNKTNNSVYASIIEQHHSDINSDTGLLKSNLERHLNKQGLTDDEIKSLSKKNLDSISSCPFTSDIKYTMQFVSSI